MMKVFRPKRFALKQLLVAIPIIMAFSLLVVYLGSNERRRQSVQAAADKAHGIAHMMVFSLGPALFFEDVRTIEEVVQSARQNSELTYFVVLDPSGRAVAEFNRIAAPAAKSVLAVAESGYFSPDEEMYHYAIPVVFEEKRAGALFFGLSLREALQLVAAYRQKLILMGFGLLIAGMGAIYFLSMAITRPLRNVSEAAREIARGDLTRRAPVMTSDESGQLAVAFNTMVDALAESRATLEERVEQRTRELQAEVAERQRVAAALRESEENFRSMVENLGEGIGLVSGDEVFLFANRTADAIFGVPQGELVGRNLRDFMSSEGYAAVRLQTGLRKQGEKSSYEIDILRPDGSARSLLVNAIPRLGAGGSFLGALSVFTDITGRKEAEREVQEANDKLQASVLTLERRNTEASLLSELYEAFQACREAEEIYETAGRYAMKLFPGDAGALYIFKESRNLLDRTAAWGPVGGATGVLLPDDCWALRRGKAHLADDPATSAVCQHVRADNGGPPYVCVPLAGRGETLGLLHIKFLGEIRDSRIKLGLPQNLAERIALAIDNFRLRTKLLQQSIRDPLTGLFNRRFMEETLGRELARSERNAAPLGVIMLDIDKFKDFNDSFGHEAGDEMLKAIGAFLAAQVRREDVVCRYGGEEFTIILPGASLEASVERARKLCEDVRPLRVAYGGSPLGPISFSLGVAVYPRHGSTGMAVVQAADMALLKAKKDGRNRVVVAE